MVFNKLAQISTATALLSMKADNPTSKIGTELHTAIIDLDIEMDMAIRYEEDMIKEADGYNKQILEELLDALEEANGFVQEAREHLQRFEEDGMRVCAHMAAESLLDAAKVLVMQ